MITTPEEADDFDPVVKLQPVREIKYHVIPVTMTTPEEKPDVNALADAAYNEAKGGNINFWTMPDDDPEVLFWKETWKRGYNAAQKELKEREEQWISVAERLPEHDQVVVIHHENSPYNPVVARYRRDHKSPFVISAGSDWTLDHVTHWMPLTDIPSPPKTVKDK